MMNTYRSTKTVKSIFGEFRNIDVIAMDNNNIKIIYSDSRNAEDAYMSLKSIYRIYMPCTKRTLNELRHVAHTLNLHNYASLNIYEITRSKKQNIHIMHMNCEYIIYLY